MAELPIWPWTLCKLVVDDYGLEDDNNVRRTPMSDGAVHQQQITSEPFKIRRFEVIVPQSTLVQFRAWVRLNGSRWFQFTDIDDGATRTCRIIGGTVELQRSRRQDEMIVTRDPDGKAQREIVWRGNVELEGFESPAPSAPADDMMDPTGPTQ